MYQKFLVFYFYILVLKFYKLKSPGWSILFITWFHTFKDSTIVPPSAVLLSVVSVTHG